MTARGTAFGIAASLLLGVPSLALAQDPPAAPAGGAEIVSYDDVREAEQADRDRRDAERADADRNREDRSENDDSRSERLNRRIDDVNARRLQEMVQWEAERIRNENLKTEEAWREEERKRMETCQTNMDADKKRTIQDVHRTTAETIRNVLSAGAPGSSELAAQMARTRDSIISGIVDQECGAMHDRLNRQRTEDATQRILDGTVGPAPFRIDQAGTPRGN